jgi:hypothetical protein
MAKSGIPWIDALYDWCVLLLVDAARYLGISYEEINVWLFCLLWPALTVGMGLWIALLTQKIRILRKKELNLSNPH